MRYADAGVNIEAGNDLVERIRRHADKTRRPEVCSSIGGFAGAVAIPAGYKEPLLVSSTDGVGTKLKVAFALGRHDTIGIDLVAMNVDDIAVVGAEPLFFLDYFACGRLDPVIAEQVIAGIAQGCQQAGCALVGGETAEMPGFYAEGEYDVAGFCTGVVDKSDLVDGRALSPGDRVLGLASSGLHSNGYTLARAVLLERMKLSLEERISELGCTLGEELLRPTRIYAPALLGLRRAGLLLGAAHITGGGLIDNPPRMLRENLAVRIDRRAWRVPPIFRLIGDGGLVAEGEMMRTFNMGLGMLVAVRNEQTGAARKLLESAGEQVFEVGEITRRNGADRLELV